MLSLLLCQSLPQKPGVYLFLDNQGSIIYVGKAKNLRNRVSSYCVNPKNLGEKTRHLVTHIASVKTIVVESELESLLLEANYIKKYKPKYNTKLTDGKSYLLIKINVHDKYPSILLARQTAIIDDSKSIYFGPFPSTKSLKMVLKTIRRIFPFHSIFNHPKTLCLYNHLGLCPCLPYYNSEQKNKEYKLVIYYIIQFLSGKKKQVLRDLEKERNLLSRNEEFEHAQKIQQKIDSITYVTSGFKSPFEYELNPNLRSDIRQSELDALKNILNDHGVGIKSLERIECYDISNISGTNSVGSMVVLTRGEKDNSQYRRFKISKNIVGPNDFAMMSEVLERRLRHTEWPMPGLVIVDGGKGQISCAVKILFKQGITIPLIGLAKREETIITSDFKEIKLPKDSKALHMVQRIRDEAHRFAITYHRKLRSKAISV